MKKTTKKTPKTEEYNASIRIFGKVYNATGNTTKEAIENLKVTGKAGGICVLSVTHGDKRIEKIINGAQVFRLFSLSRIVREIALKNVSLMFSL